MNHSTCVLCIIQIGLCVHSKWIVFIQCGLCSFNVGECMGDGSFKVGCVVCVGECMGDRLMGMWWCECVGGVYVVECMGDRLMGM